MWGGQGTADLVWMGGAVSWRAVRDWPSSLCAPFAKMEQRKSGDVLWSAVGWGGGETSLLSSWERFGTVPYRCAIDKEVLGSRQRTVCLGDDMTSSKKNCQKVQKTSVTPQLTSGVC